jgi:nitrogen regulatory protein P-II 1
MKRVVAIIKPFKFDEVKGALQQAGLEGATMTEVEGFGRQMGHTELYKGAMHAIEYIPKVMVEAVLGDDQLEPVIEAIRKAAHTGHIGDGKIFESNIDEATRIRTGESGSEAI